MYRTLLTNKENNQFLNEFMNRKSRKKRQEHFIHNFLIEVNYMYFTNVCASLIKIECAFICFSVRRHVNTNFHNHYIIKLKYILQH